MKRKIEINCGQQIEHSNKSEMNAQQKQERREQKLQKEKQRKLKKMLEKLTPQTANIMDLVVELTLLRAKMRYLERSDYRAFQNVEQWWDKGFLTDSDEESGSDSD